MKSIMKTLRVFLACLFIVGAIVPYVNGCSCRLSHPQQQFCQADLVIIGTIESKEYISGPPTIRYNVNINSIKKGEQYAQLWADENKLFINTTSRSNNCGVPWLEVGQRYLLSVLVTNGEGSLNYCHFNQLYSELTNMQRRGFNGAYNGGCSPQCQIHTCQPGSNCPLTPPDDTTCVHGNSHTNQDCYYYHGYCKARPSGTCVWKINSNFDSCLQEMNQVS